MTKVAVKPSGIFRSTFFLPKFQKMAKKSSKVDTSTKYCRKTFFWSWRTVKKIISLFSSLNFKILVLKVFAARVFLAVFVFFPCVFRQKDETIFSNPLDC